MITSSKIITYHSLFVNTESNLADAKVILLPLVAVIFALPGSDIARSARSDILFAPKTREANTTRR